MGNLSHSGESSLTIVFSCILLSDIHLCIVFDLLTSLYYKKLGPGDARSPNGRRVWLPGPATSGSEPAEGNYRACRLCLLLRKCA